MGGWVVAWSNVILDPTLALIRAQLGFRIQVGVECGNNPIIIIANVKFLQEHLSVFVYLCVSMNYNI